MAMTDKETQNPADLDLHKLEIRVEELIRACSYLKDENKSLRATQDNLVAERAAHSSKRQNWRVPGLKP